MPLQGCPFLEAVCAIERYAILAVIAERLVRILLSVLITQSEGHVLGKLVSKGERTAVTMDVLGHERVDVRHAGNGIEQNAASTRIVCILVEEFRGEQRVIEEIPGGGVANIIQLHVV